MLKRVIVYVVLILAILALLVFFIRSIHRGQKPPAANGMVLFYSKICPHCMNVERFIDSNQVMSKLKLIQKQVNTHIKEVMAVAKICKLNPQRLAIPLLWTGKACIIGDKPVIDYFKQQMSGK